MGKVDLAEVLGWGALAQPVIDKVRDSIDAVGAIPKEQRKPSHYLNASTAILNALAPLADKVEEDLKD